MIPVGSRQPSLHGDDEVLLHRLAVREPDRRGNRHILRFILATGVPNRGDVCDFKAGDDALNVGLERDRRDIVQSGAVAEARRGEELGEKGSLAG